MQMAEKIQQQKAKKLKSDHLQHMCCAGMGATCTQISLIFYPKGKKQCTVQREYCSIRDSYFIQLFIKHFAEVPVVTKKSAHGAVLYS